MQEREDPTCLGGRCGHDDTHVPRRDSLTKDQATRNRDNLKGGLPSESSVASLPVVPLQERTDAILRGLLLLLAHHGAGEGVQQAAALQLHAHLDSSANEEVWLKRTKFFLTYPIAKYLRNVLPEAPTVYFKPSGVLRRWMKARLNAFNRRNTHLWFSWVQVKRCSLPCSDSFVESTYDKHFATLSKQDDGDKDAINDILSNRTFISVLDRIRNDMPTTLFDSKFLKHSASGSACFDSTRSKGGQLASLKRMVDESYDSTLLANDELYSMRNIPVAHSTKSKIYDQTREVRGAPGQESWNDLKHIKMKESPLDCTIQAVLEPMKVRVISKGESLPYYRCRRLQKAMHRSLLRFPCFRLLGRPFCPTDLYDLRKMASEDDLWFSVDYSAATDNLSWKYSGAIFKYVIQDMDPESQQLALRVLGPHNLWYPDGKGRPRFRGLQQRGQLMGSILSFPILCLANLGVYLQVNEDRQQLWSNSEKLSSVLVNGDDMAYAAPLELWDRHVRVSGLVGLEMSVGKAYYHHTYVNINSTSVHFPLNVEGSTPWQINYLNCGLFFGQHKVQSVKDVDAPKELISARCEPEKLVKMFARAHMSQDPLEGLVPNLNLVLNGTLPGKQVNILKQFLSLHKDEIRRECACLTISDRQHLATRNLFLPISIGGMGVQVPAFLHRGFWKNFEYKVNSFQKRLGGSILTSSSALLTDSFPLPGPQQDKARFIPILAWAKPSSEVLLYSTTRINLGAYALRRFRLVQPIIFYNSVTPVGHQNYPFMDRRHSQVSGLAQQRNVLADEVEVLIPSTVEVRGSHQD